MSTNNVENQGTFVDNTLYMPIRTKTMVDYFLCNGLLFVLEVFLITRFGHLCHNLILGYQQPKLNTEYTLGSDKSFYRILSLFTAIKGCLSEFGLFSFGRALSSQPTPYQVLKQTYQKLQNDNADDFTKYCHFLGFTFTFSAFSSKSCFRPLSGGCHLTG